MVLLIAAALSMSIAQASPAPAKQTLQLDIPPGWQRTESGHYNEWRSPDGKSKFRVTVTGVSDDIRGPDAADAVKARFQKSIATVRPNANVQVTETLVCDHTQPAYRIDDPLGNGSAAFMMLIPGTQSSGLINYEIPPGATADPAMLATISKICWP
jgi:hypothetical protein